MIALSVFDFISLVPGSLSWLNLFSNRLTAWRYLLHAGDYAPFSMSLASNILDFKVMSEISLVTGLVLSRVL